MWLLVLSALLHTPAINVQDAIYKEIKRNFTNITLTFFPDRRTYDKEFINKTRLSEQYLRVWTIVKMDVLEMFSATFWYHQLSLLFLLFCLSLVTLICNRCATRELQERVLAGRVALTELGTGDRKLRTDALGLSGNCTGINGITTCSSSNDSNDTANEDNHTTRSGKRTTLSEELLADVEKLERELKSHELHVYICWLYFGLWWLDTILAVSVSHLMLQTWKMNPYYKWVGIASNVRVGLELFALLAKLFLMLRLDPLVRQAEWRRVRVLRHKLHASINSLAALISRSLRMVCPKHDMNVGSGMARRDWPPERLIEAETLAEFDQELTTAHGN